MKTTRQWFSIVLFIVLLIGSATSNGSIPLPALDRVTVMAAPKAIADFTLTDQDGKLRTLESLRGAPTLVFFGFTRCPDICPAALIKLKLMREANGGELKAARIVLISVDGERDTPAMMKKYVASFHSDLIGLTGNPRAVADIAARFSAVAYKEQADQKGNYGYFHSSQVFLLDQEGRLRASFSDASVENMTTATRFVLDEKISEAGP